MQSNAYWIVMLSMILSNDFYNFFHARLAAVASLRYWGNSVQTLQVSFFFFETMLSSFYTYTTTIIIIWSMACTEIAQKENVATCQSSSGGEKKLKLFNNWTSCWGKPHKGLAAIRQKVLPHQNFWFCHAKRFRLVLPRFCLGFPRFPLSFP